MTLKFPPPPLLTSPEFQAVNRWLLEIQSILSGSVTTLADGVTAVTQPPGDNSDAVATDAFVLANTASTPSTSIPLMDATPGEVGTSVQFARGDHVHPTDTTRASTVSPAFTGIPTAPTAAALTGNTQLATTAYADLAVGVETARAEAAEALLAPLNSPAFIGAPTAPTQSPGTANTDLATCAFVAAAVAAIGAGLVTAWANASGGATPAIVNAANIASVAHGGTGLYDFTFTSAYPDTNYGIVANALEGSAGFICAVVSKSVNGFRVNTVNSGGGSADASGLYVAVLGT